MDKIILKDSAYSPKKGTILTIKPLTENEKLFEIVLEGGQRLDHEPGQFVMVFVFGVGEIPISVSSQYLRIVLSFSIKSTDIGYRLGWSHMWINYRMTS